MVTEATEDLIMESVGDNEDPADFATMIDLLTAQRRPFHPDRLEAEVEEVSGILTCLRHPVKTDDYINTMRAFRLLFEGVADNRVLQMLFTASIFPAALGVADVDDIVFKPSMYFNPILVMSARGIEANDQALDGHFASFFVDHGRLLAV